MSAYHYGILRKCLVTSDQTSQLPSFCLYRLPKGLRRPDPPIFSDCEILRGHLTLRTLFHVPNELHGPLLSLAYGKHRLLQRTNHEQNRSSTILFIYLLGSLRQQGLPDLSLPWEKM